jgi:gamma-glutamyl-gamma-aminobutyraldehyde dehydrogenase
VTSFQEPDDAIRLANDTVYGLAAGLWTRDISLAHRAAREIKAGLVWVNGWDACDITMRSAASSNPASAATIAPRASQIR